LAIKNDVEYIITYTLLGRRDYSPFVLWKILSLLSI